MTVQVTDHVDRALDRLPSQWEGKTKMEAVVSAFAEQGQDIETALYQLFINRTIDNVATDVSGFDVKHAHVTPVDEAHRRYVIVATGFSPNSN